MSCRFYKRFPRVGTQASQVTQVDPAMISKYRLQETTLWNPWYLVVDVLISVSQKRAVYSWFQTSVYIIATGSSIHLPIRSTKFVCLKRLICLVFLGGGAQVETLMPWATQGLDISWYFYSFSQDDHWIASRYLGDGSIGSIRVGRQASRPRLAGKGGERSIKRMGPGVVNVNIHDPSYSADEKKESPRALGTDRPIGIFPLYNDTHELLVTRNSATHSFLGGTTLTSEQGRQWQCRDCRLLRLAEQFVKSFCWMISTEVTAHGFSCFSGAIGLRERATWRATWIPIYGPAAINDFQDFCRSTCCDFLWLQVMGVDLAWMPSFDFQCRAKLIGRVL